MTYLIRIWFATVQFLLKLTLREFQQELRLLHLVSVSVDGFRDYVFSTASFETSYIRLSPKLL